jgi:hypothetical protein
VNVKFPGRDSHTVLPLSFYFIPEEFVLSGTMEEVKSKNPPEDSKAAQKPSTDNKDTPAEKNPADPPVKIRKKPGRKPNPQSPAIRK